MDRGKLLDEWQELKSSIKQHWQRVTDEDLSKFDATLVALADVLQERYGMTKERAVHDVRDFFHRLGDRMAERAGRVRDAAADALERGRERLEAGVRAGRARVEEAPFRSLALAAAGGALLALLLRRR